jgi:AcrR family transcriptional regulator
MRKPPQVRPHGKNPRGARRRDRNPVRARGALVAAAEKLFRRHGYFATDSNAIARAAGYAPASFYTHFRDKLDIFLFVYERWVMGEWRAIERALAESVDERDWLSDVIDSIMNHHRAWRRFRASLRAMAAIEPAVRTAQNKQRQRQMKWLQDLCAAKQLGTPDAPMSLAILLATERILDAVAEGDASTVGVGPEQIRVSLTEMLYRMLGRTTQ